MFDQTGMSQLQMALGIISKDLDRVQASLITYEDLMLKSERVKPELKEVVNSYRAQASELRKEMLSICNILTAMYKKTCILASVPSAVMTPALVEPSAVLTPVRTDPTNPSAVQEAIAQLEVAAPAPAEEPVQESFPEDDPAAVAELDSDIPV